MDRIAISKTINILTLAIMIAYLVIGAQCLIWIAVLLTLGNSLESRINATIARYWMKFAVVLGAINSKIMLTLSFYLILTPIAFVFRIFDRRIVNHFRLNKRRSCFEGIDKRYARSDFEKTW